MPNDERVVVVGQFARQRIGVVDPDGLEVDRPGAPELAGDHGADRG